MILDIDDIKEYIKDDQQKEIFDIIIENYLLIKREQYKNFDYYTIPTGKVYGDIMEKEIINSFSNFEKYSSSNDYDATELVNDQKIEVKSTRMVYKGNNFLANRIMDSNYEYPWRTTGKWEQVKTYKADWFFMHILFGDTERVYLIPSFCVSENAGAKNKEEGKLTLSGQHAGNSKEGQISITKKLYLDDTFLITDYDHKKINQDFNLYALKIINNLIEKGIEIPEKFAKIYCKQ